MIDTDKYEGHTEGPWAWDDLHSSGKEMLFVHRKGNDNDIIANVNGVINGKLECANAQLIADAPLILEDYKRLREDNKKLHDAINGCAYANMQGSAHDLYCESMVERCPICDENVESGLCDKECEEE